MSNQKLVDPFGRSISYLRISVTDRCDFRCVYCMSEEMIFLQRKQVLSLEELAYITQAFVELGITKVRITGGEPLVRRDIMTLFNNIGQIPNLKELCISTNGSQLDRFATPLKLSGVDRINISLDTLNQERFKQLTRTGDLEKVLKGIRSAQSAGFKQIKLNAVIMKGRNDDEIESLVEFALNNHLDLSFIEEMPLGEIAEHQRGETLFTTDEIIQRLSKRYKMTPLSISTGGPSKYWRLDEHSSKIGFISPHSHNFCGDCNRVRVTVEGRLLLCLGNEHSVDLKSIIRENPGDMDLLKKTIIAALQLKPERHHFSSEGDVQIVRFMNMTGG